MKQVPTTAISGIGIDELAICYCKFINININNPCIYSLSHIIISRCADMDKVTNAEIGLGKILGNVIKQLSAADIGIDEAIYY